MRHNLARREIWGSYSLKNYHTHTFRCKHADGDVSDYAQAAVDKGLTVLGITDHTPLPDNRWLSIRMGVSALPAYARAIDEVQAREPGLTILKGAECEWAPEYHGFFRDVLLGEYRFDYLILGCHFYPLRGRWRSSHGDLTDPGHLAAYTKHLTASMQSGLFAFVAHPDLFGLSYPRWDQHTLAASREILQAAQDLDLPLEMNGYGLMKRVSKTHTGVRTAYPWRPFWELAREYEIKVVVNSDAHRPDYVDLGIVEGEAMAKELGLSLANLDHLERR